MVKKSKSNSTQHSHYIAIVAVVAVVAVIILVMSSMGTLKVSDDALAGEGVRGSKAVKQSKGSQVVEESTSCVDPDKNNPNPLDESTGVILESGTVYLDFCINENIVNEFGCNEDGGVSSESFPCPGECVEGACTGGGMAGIINIIGPPVIFSPESIKNMECTSQINDCGLITQLELDNQLNGLKEEIEGIYDYLWSDSYNSQLETKFSIYLYNNGVKNFRLIEKVTESISTCNDHCGYDDCLFGLEKNNDDIFIDAVRCYDKFNKGTCFCRQYGTEGVVLPSN